MSKYTYVENFQFMLGDNRSEEVKLPYQDMETVKSSLENLPIYLWSYPLTGHPYLELNAENRRVKSSRIKKLEEKDGFWEATTQSGTVYRLITE